MNNIKKKLKKKFKKKVLPVFKPFYEKIATNWDLARLYGLSTAIRLADISRRSKKTNSPINERMSSATLGMAKDQLVPGSALKEGWLYHDFPLPEYDFASHRKNSVQRLKKIRANIPIYKARVLDIGCSSGGISLGIGLLGAQKVVGIDHDPTAVALGNIAAEKYNIDNVELRNASIENFEVPQVDVIVWLSQWMWMVKAHSLEYGKDLLFEIPAKSGARFMIFESAADDGKAAIPGTTQDDIEDFLVNSTPFAQIKNIGMFEDHWRMPGQERMVFVCSDPQVAWDGKEAVIKRVDRNTVLKEYQPQRDWAKRLEAHCLRKLEPFPYFPRLIDEGEDWIKMEWSGFRVTNLRQLDQLKEIISILVDQQIAHRDICLENLLFRNGQLTLIDFGWAITDGMAPPCEPPIGLGRGFYDPDNRNDADAAARVYAFMKKQA